MHNIITMKTKYHRTKCTVKLQKSVHNPSDYYLIIEAYPVFDENSKQPKRQIISLNRTVTTPIWDKEKTTRGGNFKPKRNAEGVIQCRSQKDKEACVFAQKYSQVKQSEFDNRALYPEQYLQQKEVERKASIDFIEYIRDLTKRRSTTVGIGLTGQWEVLLKKIEVYAGGKPVKFSDLTKKWLDGFRNYLMTLKITDEKRLSANTQKLYITHFKTVLATAYREEITATDLSKKVPTIKGEESHRVCLTVEELETLAKTPIKNTDIRNACLFSALTGLRHSDIEKLTWGEITDDKENPRIEYRQKKTKGLSYQPISQQALELCGERQSPETLVFPNLQKSVHIGISIKAWAKRAGIKKHITFHCFRHTYATLQLSGGTDIYTVSKMLGHSDIKTTQIYAKVVDETKQKTTQAIKLKL